MRAPVKPDVPAQGQESVWRYPRPAVVEPMRAHLVVEVDGRVIAQTRRGYRTLETSHPPSYYFPPADIEPGCLVPADGRSLCEWKGGARYFDLLGAGRRIARAAWSYPDPTPSFASIRDYVSFYPRLASACFVDGERVIPQEGDFYGGWITGGVCGPFKGARGTEGW